MRYPPVESASRIGHGQTACAATRKSSGCERHQIAELEVSEIVFDYGFNDWTARTNSVVFAIPLCAGYHPHPIYWTIITKSARIYWTIWACAAVAHKIFIGGKISTDTSNTQSRLTFCSICTSIFHTFVLNPISGHWKQKSLKLKQFCKRKPERKWMFQSKCVSTEAISMVKLKFFRRENIRFVIWFSMWWNVQSKRCIANGNVRHMRRIQSGFQFSMLNTKYFLTLNFIRFYPTKKKNWEKKIIKTKTNRTNHPDDFDTSSLSWKQRESDDLEAATETIYKRNKPTKNIHSQFYPT